MKSRSKTIQQSISWFFNRCDQIKQSLGRSRRDVANRTDNIGMTHETKEDSLGRSKKKGNKKGTCFLFLVSLPAKLPGFSAGFGGVRLDTNDNLWREGDLLRLFDFSSPTLDFLLLFPARLALFLCTPDGVHAKIIYLLTYFSVDK